MMIQDYNLRNDRYSFPRRCLLLLIMQKRATILLKIAVVLLF
uniref:Uncharacterized protein n=1 Tax=Arundo donax TaxID=35708 RepID=A0A0A9FRN4_ARUDO